MNATTAVAMGGINQSLFLLPEKSLQQYSHDPLDVRVLVVDDNRDQSRSPKNFRSALLPAIDW